MELVTLGCWLVLPLSIQSLRRLGMHVFGSTVSLVAASAAGGGFLLLQAALLSEPALDSAILPAGTNTFQTGILLLAAVFAIVTELNTGLALQGLAKTSVHIGRGGSHQGVTRGSVGGFLAVATENGIVVGLADFIAVGGVGVARRGSAWRVGLHVEFGTVIGLVDLTTRLVLWELSAIGFLSMT